MTEKQPTNGEKPTAQEVDLTVVFTNEKTEPNVLQPESESQQVSESSKDVTSEIGATSDHLPDANLENNSDDASLEPNDQTVLYDSGLTKSTSISEKDLPTDKNLTLVDALQKTVAGTADSCGRFDSGVPLSIDATLDSASILSSPDIAQTIDPRDFDESSDRGFQSSVEETSKRAARGIPPVDRRNITESMLTVPARNISGIESGVHRDSAHISADYEVVKVLGEGGMGTVFLARQTALDRMVALKVVKRLDGDQAKRLAASGKLTAASKNRRDQFLAEAVVTGDLDHPNIVPIHDLAVAGAGTLFYVMKKVDGIPWSKVISQKSQDENLEILMKVCDAIAFAHSRGIVHRDIKPENVMLGDFGVVLLMDWGLAVPKETYAKRGTIYQTHSLGGSPAYMAPEMVLGPVDAIGPASDIYLLGATLFEIIVGRPPHFGKKVSECIQSATQNTMIEIPPSKRGELVEIAKRAMATVPTERFKTVAEFQDAMRQYRSHAESIMLTVRAEEEMELAKKSAEYNAHARVVFGFEEAFKLWDGNLRAKQGVNLAKLAYAETALIKEDFDLGLSLLDQSNEEHGPIIARLQAGKLERESRLLRLSWMKRMAVGLIAFIFVGGSGALYQISKDRDRARVAEKEATVAAIEAKEQRTIAVDQTAVAKKNLLLAEKNEQIANDNAREAASQRNIAENQKMLAEQKAAEAEHERRNAEYEAYVAQVGLAKARIDQNEFDDARRILIELRSKLGENDAASWEWKWLWYQANQSQKSEPLEDAARSLSVSHQKSRAVVTLDDGTVKLFRLDGQLGITDDAGDAFPGIVNATASAIAPDEKHLAVADSSGVIQVWEISSQKAVGRLRGHATEVSALVFVNTGQLLSAGRDGSVRLWDLATETELASCWHIGPVVDVACNPTAQPMLIAAAVANDRSGRVVVWEFNEQHNRREFLRRSDFLEHQAPVLAVAIAPSGKMIASGDRMGRILLWNPDEIPAINYGDAVSRAIERLKSNGQSISTSASSAAFRELPDLTESRPLRLISTSFQEHFRAHGDSIEVLRFNTLGTELLSASADYTLKIWDVESQSLKKTLRGHGGWVQGADFSGITDQDVVSASSDQTVRSWRLAKIQNPTPFQTNRIGPDTQIAHRDEIWSARFDRSGRRVVTASRDHTAAVLEIDPHTLRFVPIASLAEEKPQSLSEGSSFLALSMAADLANRRLFIGSADSIVRIWNLDAATETSSIPGTGLNTVLAVSQDGTLLVTGSTSGDAQALIWDVTPNRRNDIKQLHKLHGHQAAVTAVAVSSDSRWVFTADRNGMGILWNAQTGEQVGEKFPQHLGTRVNAAAFHPNGKDLLLAGDNQQVSWIRLEDRATLKNFGHLGFVTKLAISADGAAFATVSEYTAGKETRSTLTVWSFESDVGLVIQRASKFGKSDTSSPKQQVDAANPEGQILSVHFDSNGGIVACRSDDSAGRITIWQPISKTEYQVKLAVKIPAQLPACAEAISAGPSRLLTLNGDAASLWNLDSMSHLRSFRTHGGISEACFSADGEFVITASGSIRIWNVATAKSVFKLEHPHTGEVNSVDFSPQANDYRFISAGDDGIVKLWQWDPKSQQAQHLRSFAASEGEREVVNRVRFSPDGKQLLAVDNAGVARLWKIEGDGLPQEFRDANAKTSFLCGTFSKNGDWIAVGCDDRQARIWQVREGVHENISPKIVLRGHADQIEDIRFLGGDGEPLRVLTGSRDKSARIWDPRIESGTGQGREILALQRHSLGVTSVEVTADGSLLMTAGRDGTVILWPASAGGNAL